MLLETCDLWDSWSEWWGGFFSESVFCESVFCDSVFSNLYYLKMCWRGVIWAQTSPLTRLIFRAFATLFLGSYECSWDPGWFVWVVLKFFWLKKIVFLDTLVYMLRSCGSEQRSMFWIQTWFPSRLAHRYSECDVKILSHQNGKDQ